MRGHIKKRSKNSYSIVIDLGNDPLTGKRQQKWQTVHGTKKDAERALNKVLSNLDDGLFTCQTKITVAEFLLQWLKDYVATNTAPRTRERYEQIVNLHLIPNLGRIFLTRLEPNHIQSYYSRALSSGRLDGKGGLSARTVLHHHRILSESLNHAVKWGYVVRNVAQVVSPPRPVRKEITTLAPENIPTFFEEAKKLESKSGLPYYIIFLTALHTGMRRGELLGLKWSDVDFGGNVISVSRSLQVLKGGRFVFSEPKTLNARRLIAMTPTLAEELKRYQIEQEIQRSFLGIQLHNEDIVFSRPDGKPISPNNVSPAFTKVLRRAGLKLRFHDLRHSHATLMLRAGVHPKIVSERLGHATVALTLDTYSHVLPGLQEAAARTFDDSIGHLPVTQKLIGVE